MVSRREFVTMNLLPRLWATIILVLVHKIVASNYTDQVQFDSYSLLLKDQRVFLQ